MIWWILTTLRIVVIEEPRRVSLLYVCLRFDKVKRLDYINYEKRVYNFHQTKPCGCSNDNVCYSRWYVIIGARTLRGDFCDRGASARKSPPMESRPDTGGGAGGSAETDWLVKWWSLVNLRCPGGDGKVEGRKNGSMDELKACRESYLIG